MVLVLDGVLYGTLVSALPDWSQGISVCVKVAYLYCQLRLKALVCFQKVTEHAARSCCGEQINTGGIVLIG